MKSFAWPRFPEQNNLEMTELAAQRRELAQAIPGLLPGREPAIHEQLVHVCAISEYFHRHLQREPAIIASLLDSGDMFRTYPSGEFLARMTRVSFASLDRDLRRIRCREMCRIIFRDLCRLAPLEETTLDLSNLADASLETALARHYENNCERYGVPTGKASGQHQQMSILALGKLGAQELNLSSDIDLVFFYDEAGEVQGKGKDMSNQEFFIRTARGVINALDAVAEDGFVFRVDMRLRPYGDSGALILNRNAMEKYYVEQGRDWERYAFIKARAAAGDKQLGQDFLTWLTPFVYRKHLDFGAIEALREMKRLINYEVDVKALHDDLKLGHGGIREVEFVVQALQIIWGGNRPALRERKLLLVLAMLDEQSLLPRGHAAALRDAYIFLRNSEHAVQAEHDRQTQQLPTAPISRERLAYAMGYDDFDAYHEALMRHRDTVRESFSTFMSANRVEKESLVEANMYWVEIWRDPQSEDAISVLSAAGFDAPEVTARRLKDFEVHLSRGDVQEIGAERIDRLMPAVISLASREEAPEKTLERLLAIIDSISRRSTYVAFLLENLDALKRTVQLCAMSPWVAEQLQQFPILLYELTDRVTEDTVFERSKLQGELDQLMRNIEIDDLEAQMDTLRQFKNSAMLKVAVFELLDLLPIMKASDALTDIAEIVLQRAFELAWRHNVERHGEPCDEEGTPLDHAFAMVAYGKLGGIELGYGSDLDLVFLHDAPIRGRTSGDRHGDKSVENTVFYSRLAQRIIHILTSFTRFGVLYEIDLRLRPDGNKGPQVTTLAAYERYLAQSAWTWELQALVRARFVAGNPRLQPAFERIRAEQLGQPREAGKLLEDVVSMRAKMRQHLDKPDKARQDEAEDEVLLSGFDLKHGAGAIVDIEFLVQYLVLDHTCEQPELARWTDKMRILDELGKLGRLEAAEVEILQQAYLSYRSAVHYQWLGGAVSSFERLNQYRADVVAIWNKYMEPGAA